MQKRRDLIGEYTVSVEESVGEAAYAVLTIIQILKDFELNIGELECSIWLEYNGVPDELNIISIRDGQEDVVSVHSFLGGTLTDVVYERCLADARKDGEIIELHKSMDKVMLSMAIDEILNSYK